MKYRILAIILICVILLSMVTVALYKYSENPYFMFSDEQLLYCAIKSVDPSLLYDYYRGDAPDTVGRTFLFTLCIPEMTELFSRSSGMQSYREFVTKHKDTYQNPSRLANIIADSASWKLIVNEFGKHICPDIVVGTNVLTEHYDLSNWRFWDEYYSYTLNGDLFNGWDDANNTKNYCVKEFILFLPYFVDFFKEDICAMQIIRNELPMMIDSLSGSAQPQDIPKRDVLILLRDILCPDLVEK